MSFSSAKLVMFDLDSTLAESKAMLKPSMVDTLQKLLSVKKVAIVSGGNFPQFEKQILSGFTDYEAFKNLYLMPTSGTRLYVYEHNAWTMVYAKNFSVEEKKKITDAFKQAFSNINYTMPEEMYGELLEDRGTQVSFSGLGQDAPLSAKSHWDADHKKREQIVEELRKIIPEFNIQIGGTTSIDVTAFGANKASAIDGLQEYLKLTDEEVIFVGDALFPGGNDYPAISTGVECIKVENPVDTERLIKSWL
ncbi:MAG: HAD-IIB family hydrolase [Candidatus Zambryskibacteria bacterium]|nr:HAD-IIB family hydrolase [Candidatus Zambryskibacteria bacterium]